MTNTERRRQYMAARLRTSWYNTELLWERRRQYMAARLRTSWYNTELLWELKKLNPTWKHYIEDNRIHSQEVH